MKNYKWMISLIGIWLCLNCTACGQGKGELLIASESRMDSEEMLQSTEPEIGEPRTEGLTENEAETGSAPLASESGQAQSADGLSEDWNSQGEVCVYICGQVRVPGVYHLAPASRVCDAVEAAGGFSDDAGQEYWNLAAMLSDGQMIYIPTEEEAAQYQEMGFGIFGGMDAGSGSASGTGQSSGTDREGSGAGETAKIDLNTAGLSQLMTLPGIGESKAQSIIDYREQNGKFKSIEDVMKVDGIKDGLFQKIKDKITVN